MEVCDGSDSPSANQEVGIRTSLGDSGSARARKISTLSPTFYALLPLLILGSGDEPESATAHGSLLPSSSSSLDVEISASLHFSPAHLSVVSSSFSS